MNTVGIIGATGLLGRPVANALSQAGFSVAAMVRNPSKVNMPGVSLTSGDLAKADDIKRFVEGKEIIHLNLSVKQHEKESEFHTEQQGLDLLLPLAKAAGVQRISYLASLIIRYQGMNGFDWWVFRLKREAVNKIQNCGIPYTIFYPSTFMESITSQYKQGNRLLLAGKSKFPQYFISSKDYSQQVVAALKQTHTQNKDYIIQGLEPFTTNAALKLFADNYRPTKLSIASAPEGLIKFMGNFSTKMNYGAHMIEALNNYPEKFEAQSTWDELGKPQITLRNFASSF